MTLEQKIRDVLGRLSTLSEANASNLEPRTSHGKASSKVPAGVPDRVTPTDPHRPPPKERSLYDWYRWQFARVDPGDVDQINKLLFFAERDFNARSRQGPTVPTLAERRVAVRSGAHLDQEDETDGDHPAWPAPAPLGPRGYDDDSPRSVPGLDDERAAAQQVVDLYEGVRAEEAAVFENVPIQVIHKARRLHKRNSDDGRPRPPFLDWDDDERRRQIDLLRARAKGRDEIMGAKRIAQHFGVALSTVQRYLDSPAVAA
jgi:hypothetical protein